MAAAKNKTKKKATAKKKSAVNPLAALVASGAFTCWSIKSEPFVYSFDQLIADKQTSWDGVRNFEARNMMRAMKKNDTLLYYHSNEGKEIIGIARVAEEAYKDPTSPKEEDWSSVRVVPVKKLTKPIGLATMKAHPLLKDMALVKKSRISVTPVSDAELAMVLKLSGTSL